MDSSLSLRGLLQHRVHGEQVGIASPRIVLPTMHEYEDDGALSCEGT
jgi:hypothetical protein